MSYLSDPRIVATLDAGGTNLVFGAIQGGEYVKGPITLPAMAHDLDACLGQIIKGFDLLFANAAQRPIAISFAFPGPADYPRGIIGGFLPNFPSFRDGVALGPMLEERFGVPVFINNDGDLFAYGESLCGILPEINQRLEAMGAQKRFHNLIGYTVGTGLGIGFVINGHLNRGDNSCVETFCLPHPTKSDVIIEEGSDVPQLVFEVEPKDVNGNKVSNPSAPITFRLPVPDAIGNEYDYAEVIHEEESMGKTMTTLEFHMQQEHASRKKVQATSVSTDRHMNREEVAHIYITRP